MFLPEHAMVKSTQANACRTCNYYLNGHYPERHHRYSSRTCGHLNVSLRKEATRWIWKNNPNGRGTHSVNHNGQRYER